MVRTVARNVAGHNCSYGNNRMCSEAFRTLSFVILVALAGAFPKAKLILCSRNSSSVTGVRRDASKAFCNSGSALISPRNCFLSAIDHDPFSFCSVSCEPFSLGIFNLRPNLVNSLHRLSVDYFGLKRGAMPCMRRQKRNFFGRPTVLTCAGQGCRILSS